MSVKTQFKPTHQQADGAAFLPYERVLIAVASDGGKVYLPIDKGTMVLGIVARCVKSVTGGTPAVTVGDKAAVDTWIAAAATLETAGNVASTLADKPPKYYSAPDYIVVGFNASAAAGEIELRILFSGV